MLTSIEKLKRDHREIYLLLRQLDDSDLTVSEVCDLVKRAHRFILDHLAMEDNEVYPAIYARADQDITVKKRLEVLETELTFVAEHLGHFFDQYSETIDDVDVFKQRYYLISQLLRNRIYHEEMFLFPEFEKGQLAQKKSQD